MQAVLAGLLGGLAGGLATTVAMKAGYRSGLLHETLDRKGENWLDRIAGTRALVGQPGTAAMEQTGHMGASAALGLGYAALREVFPDTPPALLGSAYGAGLYAVNIAGIAPLIGLTEGEVRAGPGPAAQRLAMHVLYGLVTAVVAESLTARQPGAWQD